MEHRWGQRIVVDMPIHMTVANASLIKRVQLANLSITGALIKSDFRPRVLSRVELVFVSSLSRQGEAPSIAAYVTRSHGQGIGVAWCESASPAVTDLVRAASSQSPRLPYARVDSAQLTIPAGSYDEDPDGASAPPYRSPLEASGLTMPAEPPLDAVTLHPIRWAKSAHPQMTARRHERIALVAYSIAQARGFQPGHDTDDWLRAQSQVNAQDAGS